MAAPSNVFKYRPHAPESARVSVLTSHYSWLVRLLVRVSLRRAACRLGFCFAWLASQFGFGPAFALFLCRKRAKRYVSQSSVLAPLKNDGLAQKRSNGLGEPFTFGQQLTASGLSFNLFGRHMEGSARAHLPQNSAAQFRFSFQQARGISQHNNPP